MLIGQLQTSEAFGIALFDCNRNPRCTRLRNSFADFGLWNSSQRVLEIVLVGCVLALGVLVLGHVALAWNSPDYGFDRSISASIRPHRRLQLDASHILTFLFWC
jgi:hypothetical protein